VRRQDFAYDLPAELIAQEPPAERSAGRLLVLEATGALTDSLVRELPRYLRGGDLLVLNDTRVVPARAFGRKPSGGRVEIFLERALAGDEALVQLAASKAIAPGLKIATQAGPVQVLERTEGLWRVRLPLEALQFFERCGQVPLPPYIHRPPAPADRERYQSIFARAPGAVAAPTASLHFDEALTQALLAQGVGATRITLHVGAGTFQPLRVDEIARHVMHPERVSIGAEACEAIARTRARGGRVVAIGTTVVRALETAARALPDAAGTLTPFEGETRLFITPGFQFQMTDMLLTNFHLPESTLLMLVCAFAGQERVLAAYRHAVTACYRFFSYGDAMLLTRSAA
jgi:S-adenosylmethionine:tRNA ribosyltransferase-isomerase